MQYCLYFLFWRKYWKCNSHFSQFCWLDKREAFDFSHYYFHWIICLPIEKSVPGYARVRLHGHIKTRISLRWKHLYKSTWFLTVSVNFSSPLSKYPSYNLSFLFLFFGAMRCAFIWKICLIQILSNVLSVVTFDGTQFEELDSLIESVSPVSPILLDNLSN